MSLSAPCGDRALLYDRMAPGYDRRHRRWLKHAGGEAQAALEAVVRALARPKTALLDAGCGTGAFARALIDEGMAPSRITLLDTSDAMLARCADMQARPVKGRLESLPFETGAFDLVTCAWALETAHRPETALAELCRVVGDDGVLCLAFCSDNPARDPAGWLMRQAVTRRGAGLFLCKRHVIETIERQHGFEVRLLPCAGPVAALIARRIDVGQKATHRAIACPIA